MTRVSYALNLRKSEEEKEAYLKVTINANFKGLRHKIRNKKEIALFQRVRH